MDTFAYPESRPGIPNTTYHFKHAMLDIESMSTHPGFALVLSVAIVPFNLAPFEVAPRFQAFEAILDIGSQLVMGRECSPSTQRWWGAQSDIATSPWLGKAGDKPGIFAVNLAHFWKGLDPNANLWANGVSFDVSNVESLVLASGEKLPWKYNAIRDARTVYKLTNAADPTPEEIEPFWTGETATHDPYFDCIYQIVKLDKAMESWPGAGGRVLIGPAFAQGAVERGV